MVEYAYLYPLTYNQTGSASLSNLVNITGESSFASVDNFSGKSVSVNVSSFTSPSLPDDVSVTARYVEVATELVIRKGSPVVVGGNETIGYYGIPNSLKVKRFDTDSNSFSYNFQAISNGISSDYTLRVHYIRLVIEYESPKYNLSAMRMDRNNTLGSETSIRVEITNINKTDHRPVVHISPPEGVILRRVEGDSSIRDLDSPNDVDWYPNISSTRLNDSITVTYASTTLGYKEFTITETYGGRSSVIFNVIPPDSTPDEDETGIPISHIQYGEEGLYNITYPVYQNGLESFYIYVKVDDEFINHLNRIRLTDSDGLCENVPWHYESDFVNNTCTFVITPTDSGHTNLQIEYELTVDGETTTHKAQTYTLNVLPLDLTTPYFTIIPLSEEEKNRLGNHINYTCQTSMKINTYTNPSDWLRNYRIGVYNPEELPEETIIEDLTPEQIFNGVEEWSNQPTLMNEYDNLTCTFTYHEENPIYIVVTGDYPEGIRQANIEFTNPCLVETTQYQGYESTGNYFTPINDLITDTGASNILVTKYTESTGVVLNTFDLPEDFGTNNTLGVTGVQLDLECEYNDILSLMVRLNSPDGTSGQRSIILDEPTPVITIGGPYDTFGFDVTELTQLDDFEVELRANNFFNNPSDSAQLTVHNAKLTFYYNTIDTAQVDVLVDGKDIRYYGLFLEDAEIPEGLNTITKYLEIEGTDSHDSYRQNIDKKEITLKMNVDSCNINDTTTMLRRLTQLFQNKRDVLNRPIPKRIEFSNYPDLYWEYIIEDSFQTSFDVTNAVVELTLVIPSGTAFAKEETITNTTGGVTGLAKVNPLITIIPLGDHVEIVETRTGQKFSMNYTDWSENDLVQIDCMNREVLLNRDTYESVDKDISKAVDFNSDWFILHDDYIFEPTNCIIQSVTFTERW